MKNLIFLCLITYGAYQWYSNNEGSSGHYIEPHDEVIMYSLTTCGYCKIKARELKEENILFTEYFIDEDHDKKIELNSKLIASGYKPKRYGTPIIDVHGVMLPNNPKMSLIKSKLQITK